MVLQREVSRIFLKRRWTSLDAAEIATGVPASTINRMRRGMSVKPEAVIKFGTASGEPRELWGLYALDIEPSAITGIVAQQALSPEVESILEYIEDPQTRQAVRYFHGLPPEMRPAALGALEGMRRYKDAGEIAQELEEEATLGKRAGRREHPSVPADRGEPSS